MTTREPFICPKCQAVGFVSALAPTPTYDRAFHWVCLNCFHGSPWPEWTPAPKLHVGTAEDSNGPS